jgi:chromosome segregation ATPase
MGDPMTKNERKILEKVTFILARHVRFENSDGEKYASDLLDQLDDLDEPEEELQAKIEELEDQRGDIEEERCQLANRVTDLVLKNQWLHEEFKALKKENVELKKSIKEWQKWEETKTEELRKAWQAKINLQAQIDGAKLDADLLDSGYNSGRKS